MATALSSEVGEETINCFKDVLCKLRAGKQMYFLILNFKFCGFFVSRGRFYLVQEW
jgi:hypothetical protein